jgi:hypothetical protein
MADNVLQLGINIDTKKAIETASGLTPKNTNILRLISGERPVIAGTFLNNNLAAPAFDANDTFEMNVDIDFIHDKYAGTLNAAYSGAVTSIAITFTQDITGIRETGSLTLKDNSNPDNRERVAYTNVVVSGAGLIGTFTVSKTLVNSYDSGDYGALQDRLMAQATEDDVNTGEWTDADKTAGKVSFRLDCRDTTFSEKLATAGSDFEYKIYMEIKRYPTGSVIPVVLMQDVVYGRQTVNDLEEVTIPSDENWTAADARYIHAFADQSDIGEDIVDADELIINNVSGSIAKTAMSRVRTYIETGLTIAATSVTFVNTVTQMVATNVQTAIDELWTKFISSGSTSHRYGGTLSINGGDNTKFDMTAGSCDINDSHTDAENPTSVKVTWTAFTAEAVPDIATQPFTVISINSSGTLLKEAAAPTKGDRRDKNVIGILIHPTGVISDAITVPLWAQDTTLALYDFLESLGSTFNRTGNAYSENGANLKIDKSAGEMYAIGYNWDNDKKNPNITTDASGSAITFSRHDRQTAAPLAVTDLIDPNFYDPDGTGLVAVPTGWYSTPRFYFDPASGSHIFQYSQYVYDSLLKAVKSAEKEVFVEIAATASFNCRTILAVQEGSTVLNDDLSRKFIQLGAFGCRTLNGVPTFSRFVEAVETANALSYQQQSINLLVDTGVIYADVQADGGGDIIYPFQQREYTLDCTTGSGAGGTARVALTAGTATVPKKNWIYVTRSGDVATLNASTSAPTGEYAMVCTAFLPDVTTFTNRDAYGSRRWTEAKTLNGRGVIATILSKLRDLALGYISGLTPVPDFATASEIDLTVASGVVKQIYEQTTDALQVTVDGALVVNDQTTPYTEVSDLADITTDTAGGSLTTNNTYYQLVIAISTNTDGSTQLLVNKPTGSYSNASDAFNDINGYSVTSFPSDFDTVALVCALVIRVQTGLIYSNAATAFGVDFIDLRGVDPGGSASGSGAASVTSFSDAAFSIFNSVSSFLVTLDLVNLTADRVLTPLDKDYTIGDMLGIASVIDNRMVRFDGTGGKQVQTSLLFVDDNGDTGVAEDSPATRLHVSESSATVYDSGTPQGAEFSTIMVQNLANSNTSAAQITFRQRTTGDNDCSIGATGGVTQQMFFKVDGAEVARFNNSGSLLIGTITGDADAQLQGDSTTQGWLPPRLTTTQRDLISTPPTGLMIVNTTTGQYEWYTGSAWAAIGPAGSGEANTASNVGGFVGWFKQKTGVDLEFKTAQSSDSTLTLTANTSDVDLIVNKAKAQQRVLNAQTGTAYTGVLTDAEKRITMDNASANTFTIPTNASVAYDVNQALVIVQKGAGLTSVKGDTGVTVNGTSGGTVAGNGQYETLIAVKVATDTWLVSKTGGGGASSFDSEVTLRTSNGYGSTNNKIRRFLTTVTDTGSDITYADSATLGATFTIETDGIYAISYSDNFSVTEWLALTLNSTALTTAASVTANDAFRITVGVTPGANLAACVSTTRHFSSGDVIRAHTDGTSTGSAVKTNFSIARVG